MIKKSLAAIVLVSGLWAVLDHLLNILVLSVVQTQPAAPQELLISLVTQYRSIGIPIAATLFILVYVLSIRQRTFASGTAYGLVVGFTVSILATLISLTTVEPALTDMAVKLLACICQTTLAGMFTAWIFKPQN